MIQSSCGDTIIMRSPLDYFAIFYNKRGMVRKVTRTHHKASGILSSEEFCHIPFENKLSLKFCSLMNGSNIMLIPNLVNLLFNVLDIY